MRSPTPLIFSYAGLSDIVTYGIIKGQMCLLGQVIFWWILTSYITIILSDSSYRKTVFVGRLFLTPYFRLQICFWCCTKAVVVVLRWNTCMAPAWYYPYFGFASLFTALFWNLSRVHPGLYWREVSIDLYGLMSDS